jgi:hypothetical protein
VPPTSVLLGVYANNLNRMGVSQASFAELKLLTLPLGLHHPCIVDGQGACSI